MWGHRHNLKKFAELLDDLLVVICVEPGQFYDETNQLDQRLEHKLV